MNIDSSTTYADVFDLAAKATTWRQTAQGYEINVRYQGYDWQIVLPPMRRDVNGEERPTKAVLASRFGYGGWEPIEIEATWGQTLGIVEAVMSAFGGADAHV